jgi:hypothetical protein
MTLTRQMQNLYESTHLADLAADEFTVTMFAKTNRCTTSVASRLIQKAIDSDVIECVGDRLAQGKRMRAYRFLVQPS